MAFQFEESSNLKKKSIFFVISNIASSNSVLFPLLELLIKWILEPLKLSSISFNCAFNFNPIKLIGWLTQSIIGWITQRYLLLYYFSDISSLEFILVSEIFILMNIFFILHISNCSFFMSSCFYLSFKISYPPCRLWCLPLLLGDFGRAFVYSRVYCSVLFGMNSLPDHWCLGLLSLVCLSFFSGHFSFLLSLSPSVCDYPYISLEIMWFIVIRPWNCSNI